MAPKPTKLRNILGNPVQGEDFWPRPDVVDGLLADLVGGRASHRFFALRRIGKTSVLLELERRLREESGLTTIRIDAQGISTFKDFLIKVSGQIPSEGFLQQTRHKIAANRALKSRLTDVWTRFTNAATTQASSGFQNEFDHHAVWAGDIEVALRAAGPIVLIIDELPYMLRNMMRDGYKAWDAERFLATLRNWRFNSGVRMLLSGSIGLAQLQRLNGVQVADHIGDLPPAHLPPLERQDAIALVEALARGAEAQGWTIALSEAIVDASTETWPIFLQYGFASVFRGGPRDPAGIRQVIETQVRRDLNETFYQQFATRLSRYEKDEKPARTLLRTLVAQAPEPLSFGQIDAALDKIGALERRDDLLEALREDDFILFDTEAQSLRPASKLVPVWVRARAWGP